MILYIIYAGKNCACRKNAALGPHLKHGTHDAPASTGTFELQSINFHEFSPVLSCFKG